MKLSKVLICLAVSSSLFFTNCASSQGVRFNAEAEERHRFLAKLAASDPIADCNQALKKGDARFLAVLGYALSVPGIDDFQIRYTGKYKYRIIEGTSEFVYGPRDLKDQNAVWRYAERYNRFLLKKLSAH